MLLAFGICAAAALVTLFTLDNRVLTPVKQLGDFAEDLAQGDTALPQQWNRRMILALLQRT